MKIKSGNTYSLSEIFQGENNKIVIPDLQRDYCWGSSERNLAGSFIQSLMSLNKGKDITLGLIYGYYDELIPDHLLICDGQQRLTTLFIAIGCINRKLGFDKYTHLLISNFELQEDDKEPYLQYAVRESSLDFLRDFTYNYLLNRGKSKIEDSDDIRNQPWFLSNYSLDPTIESILLATKAIEEVFRSLTEDELEEFGIFLTTKLRFLFYDMKSRVNGEEAFVLINTTGEPLSPTQNLKPLVISQNKDVPNVAKLWEDMETWFWKNRHKSGTSYSHTSDEGMACFFNVVHLLYSRSEEEAYEAVDGNTLFPYKAINFSHIYDAFLIYKRLSDLDFSERKDESIVYPKDCSFFTQKELYAIVPVIRYCLDNKRSTDEDIKRVYHFFSNLSRYRDVWRSKEEKDGQVIWHSPIFHAKNLVAGMTSTDYLCLKERLNDKEASLKIDMISKIGDDGQRKALELLFAEAEATDIFNGQIAILVSWSHSLESFRLYWRAFQTLFSRPAIEGYTTDTVRRALIAYSWSWSWSRYHIRECYFGYTAEEWREIIKENKPHFQQILDDIKEYECTTIETELEKKIEKKLSDGVYRRKIEAQKGKGRREIQEILYEIVAHPELLQYCNTKHLYKLPDYDRWGWVLVKNKYSRPFSLWDMLLLLELKKKYQEAMASGWIIEQWQQAGHWAVMIEKVGSSQNGVVIYIRSFQGDNQKRQYMVEVNSPQVDSHILPLYCSEEFRWERINGNKYLTTIRKNRLFEFIEHCITTHENFEKEE